MVKLETVFVVLHNIHSNTCQSIDVICHNTSLLFEIENSVTDLNELLIYNLSDINMTIQSKSSASNTIHILLNGYQRSGSSYTGKLLVSQPNTFYFFEAWSSLTEWGHFTVNDLVCDDLTGACRYFQTSHWKGNTRIFLKRSFAPLRNFKHTFWYLHIMNVYECAIRQKTFEEMILRKIENSHFL